MQIDIKKIAGVCVLLAAALSINAQHKNPPKTTKTIKVNKTVVPPKKAPHKGVEVIKKVVTTKTVTTKVVSTKKAKAHKVRRRTRRHYRRHHYRRIVHRVVSMEIPSTVETGLVGVHLFDSGVKVLSIYGNPDFILNLGQAPASGSPGPAGQGGFGGPGGQGGFGGPGGAGRPPGFGGGTFGGPRGGAGNGTGGKRGPGTYGGAAGFGEDLPAIGDSNSDLQGPGFAGGKFGGGQAPGRPGAFGGAGQGFGGPGGPGGMGGVNGQSGGQNAPAPNYIQWIYKENAAQYKFILDQHDRVVQIEAIGMDDAKVHTNHGITFGATFKTLVDRYGIPDAYEISGDNLILRYLSKYHVAFRLNRLETNHPYEVTAIVVSGGKE